MGLTKVHPSRIATIVTSLEMRARAPRRPLPPSPFRLVYWPAPRPHAYRTLFARVGAPWLWFSRLILADDALTAIIHDPHVAVHAVVDPAGVELGLLELDRRVAGACELAYFGLVPELAGQGHGRWLMAETLARAWTPGTMRVWVHTCTLDHPSALGFYRAQGFTPYARHIETFPDPRLAGILPRETAPHVPIIEP